jgi:hypothetical protein
MESVTDQRNYESQRFYRIRAQAAQAVKEKKHLEKKNWLPNAADLHL